MAYITMLEELRTTGQPAAGADTFVFSEPGANSPVFDPYAPARRTVANALGTDLCQGTLSNGEIFTFATTATVATPLGDPLATSAHIGAIEEGSTTTNVSVGVSGGNLISIGLPLETVTVMPPVATPYTPDPITSAWIADVETMAITTALAFDPSTDIQHRLLGQPRDVDVLADAVWTYSTDTWGITPDDILVLEARFGIYGSLPVLVVWYDAGYFMIDGMNGLVAGPFLEGTEFNATELLEGHAEYEPGTGSRIIDSATGCTHTGLGKRWHKDPPPGFLPGILNPVSPSVTIPSPAVAWPPATPSPAPKKWWKPSQIKYSPPRKNILPPPPATLPYMPDVPGQPTHWQCKTLTGSQQGRESCSTIEIVCSSGDGKCYYRQVTCNSDVTNHPSRNGQPPADPGPPPTYHYPNWPKPATGSQPGGNDCTDSFYY